MVGGNLSSLGRDIDAAGQGGDGNSQDPQAVADGFALLLGCGCDECGQGVSDLFAEEPGF